METNRDEIIIRAKEDTTFIWVKYREDGKDNYREITFNNYFYILESDYKAKQAEISKLSHLIKDVEFIEKFDLKNNKTWFAKLILKDNLKRNELKYKIENLKIPHFEADINAVKRWLIDTNPELNQKDINWVMYDIETKDDGLFEKDMNGTIIAREPVLSIAYIDNKGRKHWLKNQNKENPYDGELKLLKEHNSIIEQYDCILAWNGKRFDDSYIKQRNEFHNLSNIHFDFINQLDYMEIVKKNYKDLDSYSLNNVAKIVVKDCKIDIGEKGKGAIYRSWLASFEGDNLLERYNIQDVQLMFDMEQELKFIDIHKTQSRLANCFIQETLHNTDMLDFILLLKFHKNNYITNTKPSKKEIEENKQGSISGAYSFCLIPGIHENLWVFDFKSFYPTTMAQYNMCVTTLGDKKYFEENNIPYCIVPSDTHLDGPHPERYYRTDKRGIIAEIAHELIVERDKIKYEVDKYIIDNPAKYRELYLYQYALKTTANSMYGALALKSFRFYNYDMGDSITTGCRALTKKCIILAESLGFQVVQGDTDSIIFKRLNNCKLTEKDLEIEFEKLFDNFAIENKLAYQFKIKSSQYGEKTANHFIVFEHEKTLDRMISVKIKNYAYTMLIEKNGEKKKIMVLKGLECKKKDTNPLAKEIQYNLVESILYNKFESELFINHIKKLYQSMLENKIETKYLIMKKSLNKNPADYGQIMIDSKTGKPKMSKDGSLRYSSVPAHVKLAKQLIAEGEDIYIGDEIKYIVKSTGPIEPISIKEYEKGSDFDREYYWRLIANPILKILFVTYPSLILENPMLWTMKPMNEKQKDKFIEKLKKEAFKDEEQEEINND